jgi:predicted nucleotidyltransferase
MVEVSTLLKWFHDRTNTASIREAWIFGSIVAGNKNANDVDVFLLYHDGGAEAVPALKRRLQADFEDQFSLPLHLLCLSETESKETDTEAFLNEALSQAVRVR